MAIDPVARIKALRDHRLTREAAIKDTLNAGPRYVEKITATVYTDVPQAIWPAAARNVFAHLVDLTGRGLATADLAASLTARFAVTRRQP